jgi:hypothetical protein
MKPRPAAGRQVAVQEPPHPPALTGSTESSPASADTSTDCETAAFTAADPCMLPPYDTQPPCLHPDLRATHVCVSSHQPQPLEKWCAVHASGIAKPAQESVPHAVRTWREGRKRPPMESCHSPAMRSAVSAALPLER